MHAYHNLKSVFEMNRCYYCGRLIEDEDQMLVKEINVGFLELSNTRETFHAECWKEWRREKRMTMIKWLGGIGGAMALFCLIIYIITILH